MGYSTEFYGSLKFNKPLTEDLIIYINKFNESRRMMRDVEKIKEIYPNWKEECFNGELGINGEYFIGGNGFLGQDRDDSILEYNYPSTTQPGLWCQWMINDDGELAWDENEKFYDYVEWLKYLIDNFFDPLGYKLNGEIEYQGEDVDDFGRIIVIDNVVYKKCGIHVFSLSDISNDDLIKEVKNRGFYLTI